MIATIEKITKISTNRISYYSIKFSDKALTEYEIFEQKSFPEHMLETQLLNKAIKEMGLRGAKPWYLIPEGGAYALPLVPDKIKRANKKDFGLRLYGIYLSESIILLLNGGIKTVSHSAQHCPNLQNFIKQAIALDKKIKRAIEDRYITVSKLTLQIDDQFIIDL